MYLKPELCSVPLECPPVVWMSDGHCALRGRWELHGRHTTYSLPFSILSRLGIYTSMARWARILTPVIKLCNNSTINQHGKVSWELIKNFKLKMAKKQTRDTSTGLTLVAFNYALQTNTNILIYSLVLHTNHSIKSLGQSKVLVLPSHLSLRCNLDISIAVTYWKSFVMTVIDQSSPLLPTVWFLVFCKMPEYQKKNHLLRKKAWVEDNRSGTKSGTLHH